jgi:hypothetical protein
MSFSDSIQRTGAVAPSITVLQGRFQAPFDQTPTKSLRTTGSTIECGGHLSIGPSGSLRALIQLEQHSRVTTLMGGHSFGFDNVNELGALFTCQFYYVLFIHVGLLAKKGFF